MTEPLKEKKIKVVLCEPGKVARVAEIGTELSDLQRVVGGLIEPYYPFEKSRSASSATTRASTTACGPAASSTEKTGR